MLQPRFFISAKEWALIGVTVLWGGTFIVVHMAMRTAPPFFFVGFRFLLASLVVGLLVRRSLLQLNRKEIFAGTLIGLSIAVGYGMQTVGLVTISSSLSAFITALYVPIVPLLQWLIMRRRPQIGNWLAILLCFIGLVLLSNPDLGAINFAYGEIATLIAAIGVAAEILLIGYFAPGLDARRLTFVQLIVASLAAFAVMPVVGENFPAFSYIWFGAACAMAAITSLIQLVMNWAQKSVSPTRATIIYAGEPVWAGIIGWLVGEAFTSHGFVGAGLICLGLIVCELFPAKPTLKSPKKERKSHDKKTFFH